MRSTLLTGTRNTKSPQHRTDFRARVLRFVELFVERNGYPPTYQEIMESVGLGSKSHVDYYLDDLEKQGLITRRPRSPRSVRPSAAQPATFGVAVEGTVRADRSVAWAEGAASTIDVTSNMAGRGRDLYALHVQGEGLLEELVCPGDILIIERRPWAMSGEVAVVCGAGRREARLAKLEHKGECGRVQRARFGTSPVVVDSREMQIDGGVVAVIRQP